MKPTPLALQVPVIRDVKTLESYVHPLYIIDNEQQSLDRYEIFVSELRNIVRASFIIKECRTYPVHFKFYQDDEKIHEVELRYFLHFIYFLYPFCYLHGVHIMDERLIYPVEESMNFADNVNRLLITPLENCGIRQRKLNRMIAKVCDSIATISLDFSEIMNLTFSDEEFFKMYDDPEYRELMEYQSTPGASPTQIEEELAECERKLVSKLRADKDNPLGIICRAKSGLKIKQLVEFMVAIGMKPTLTNEIVPISISNSNLIGGLSSASDMYIDGMGARKPLVMNVKTMGEAGYFGKNVNELTHTLTLSQDTSFCDTRHLVKYTIRTKQHLRKLLGKFYKLSLDDPDFKEIRPIDTHLVGKTIYVRSAITCNCGQNEVCPACMGTKAHLLFDMPKGIGAYLSMEMTKKFEQDVLSTKHLLTTNAEKIEFTEMFYKYFKLEGNEISLSENALGDLEELAIMVDMKKVKKFEEYDDDSTFNTFIEGGTFTMVNTTTEKGFDVSIQNDKELYLMKEVANTLRKNNGILKLRDWPMESPIFCVVIMNNELTKPLYELKTLINKKSLNNPSIDEIAQKVLDIFVEANFVTPMVSGELILNRLIRKEKNVMKRPKFNRVRVPKYKFYSMTEVLKHNSSPLLGLAYQNLKEQMMNPDLEERTEPSIMDPVFKKVIDMTPMKRYVNIDYDKLR